jgi:hypothetical protein
MTEMLKLPVSVLLAVQVKLVLNGNEPLKVKYFFISNCTSMRPIVW